MVTKMLPPVFGMPASVGYVYEAIPESASVELAREAERT